MMGEDRGEDYLNKLAILIWESAVSFSGSLLLVVFFAYTDFIVLFVTII